MADDGARNNQARHAAGGESSEDNQPLQDPLGSTTSIYDKPSIHKNEKGSQQDDSTVNPQKSHQ